MCVGLLATLISLDSSALAQDVQPDVRQGPYSAFPVGMVLSPGSVIAQQDAIYYSPPGQTSAPTALTAAVGGRPNYSLQAIFGYLNAGNQPAIPLPIPDCISIASSGLPVNWNTGTHDGKEWAWPDITDRFLTLVASVASGHGRGSLFNPTGSDSFSGSNLVSYVFRGSSGLPSHLVGKTHLEIHGGDMILQPGADIQGFDFALGMLLANPTLSTGDMVFTHEDGSSLYFSVSRHWASQHTNLFARTDATQTAATLPADGAAIYKTCWTPPAATGGTGSWSIPEVFRSRQDLGLTSSADEDVDALTIRVGSGQDIVIFSTAILPATQPQRNQLQIQTIPMLATQTTMILASALGESATSKLGLDDDDDIDGACGNDPEVNQSVPSGLDGGIIGDYYWGSAASLHPNLASLAIPAGISIARESNANNHTLIIQLTGWGGSTALTSDIALFWKTATTATHVATVTRPAGNQRFNMIIPLGPWTGTTNLSRFDIVSVTHPMSYATSEAHIVTTQ